ncbi:hypothetical protein AY601_1138 [Pedobacter cryoconitis]|uniref:PAS fold-2 domain-containing protein n=1 Tax=Pedobacter cryoconitis TaxID=188932 RepID=A0A127V9V2_9SPHI|nr:hypothetical protein [Pedobacter cryoconitis]AMP98065.1 hypothetical protein AY601_1138 [Pedobacter cryoconitis]
MSNFQVDLTNCDIEPIHIPGQIQSHGFLVVIDDEMSIQFHSDNINNFIAPVPDVLIGKSIGHIESLLDQDYQPDQAGS